MSGAPRITLEGWGWMDKDLHGAQKVSVHWESVVSHDETKARSKCDLTLIPHLAPSARGAHG